MPKNKIKKSNDKMRITNILSNKGSIINLLATNWTNNKVAVTISYDSILENKL
ncbi:MAG: hypothetical protein RR161_01795 [Bacilli bacterium]